MEKIRKWKCERCKSLGHHQGGLCNRCLRDEHRDRWRLLPAPTQAEIDNALAWLYATYDHATDDRAVTGFYVSDPDGNDQDEVFCLEHAYALAAELGEGSYVWNASDGETDSERWCCHAGCSKQLDVGSFTDEGERSVLGLTEDDPMRAGTDIYGLGRIGWRMKPTNQHAALWIFHVDYHRANESDGLATAYRPEVPDGPR